MCQPKAFCSLCPEATEVKGRKGVAMASAKVNTSHLRDRESFHKKGPGVGLPGRRRTTCPRPPRLGGPGPQLS